MTNLLLFLYWKIKKVNSNYKEPSLYLLKGNSCFNKFNTKRAYNSKKIEFEQYCEAIFPKNNNPKCVIENKLFGFIYFAVYRSKKGRYYLNSG